MNRRKMGLVTGSTVFVLIVATTGLITCGITLNDARNPPTVSPHKLDMSSFDVYRFTDLDGKVTCWLYTTYHGGGISCLATENIRWVKE